MSKKILITAFEPFRDYKENITEKVLRKIKDSEGIYKRLLPVRFEKDIFTTPLKEINPGIVIALGQYPRGNKIRIERKAVNQKGDEKSDPIKKITKNGEDVLYCTLKIKPDQISRVTYDAGKYVCNFSMYTSLDFLKTNSVKYCFLHIPKDMYVDTVVGWLEKKIKFLREG